jgi:murein DD-endopeptidase MepM/ murein hydrolase activator NlpD
MKYLFYFLMLTSLIACSSTPTPKGLSGRSPQFIWPVTKGTITRGFKHGGKKHEGLDIAGQLNSPVHAAESGRVVYGGNEFNGYGNLIIIEHDGDRWATFYAHLNHIKVREGQYVQKGDLIGLMGKTGRATGVHLHFEIRHRLHAIDPRPYLQAQPAHLVYR